MSGSFLGIKLKSVRTRIAGAVAVLAVLSAVPTLPVWAQGGLQDTPAAPTEGPVPASQVLCEPQVIGQRRIPKDSVLARISSHQGDPYDPATVERDFNSIWNTGYFEYVRIEREDTPACVQLIIIVHEKPTVRSIDYTGLNAVTLSDVQERFKRAKVGLTVESQFDETRVKRAEDVLKDLLSEHGHQFATIRTEIKTIPPSSVGITFRIKEGPTVKVGKIAFDGNNSIPDRTLRNSMVNR